MIYQRYIKRILDVLISFTCLILLMPFFVIIAIAIKLDSRGPVFFTQDRVGKDKKIFKIIKFRTMLTFEDSYYEDGTPIPNYDRITRVGKFLRKTSIDELPQLINILIGDMSIVGPRPTLPYQVEKYNGLQARRLTVRPGLTGLAQIKGRNSLTWEEKIAFDLEYIKNITFLRDLGIIFTTFIVVLRGDKVEFTKHDNISKHDNDVFLDVGGSTGESL